MKYEEQVFVNKVFEDDLTNAVHRDAFRTSTEHLVNTTLDCIATTQWFAKCRDCVLFVLDEDWKHQYMYIIHQYGNKHNFIFHFCFADATIGKLTYYKIKDKFNLNNSSLFGKYCCAKKGTYYVSLRYLFDHLNETMLLYEPKKGKFNFEYWCDRHNLPYTVSQDRKEDTCNTTLVNIEGKVYTLEDIINENKRLKKTMEHLWKEQGDWEKKKEDFEKQCLKCQEQYLKESAYNEALKKELNDVKQQLKTQDFEMWMASVSCDKIRERNLELTKENQELKTKYAIFDVPHIKAKWQTFLETLKRMEDINGNTTETTTIRD